MACQLFLAPSFRLLEGELVATLRESCRRRPLDPKWVLVPSSTVANHLRMRLGQLSRQEVWAGVRVTPLPVFLLRLQRFRGERWGSRWSPAFDFLLYELVHRLPVSSPLAPLRRLPGGYVHLRPTFLDLAEGGFGPGEVQLLEELAAEPDLRPVESETLKLYRLWVELVEAAEIPWQPLVQQRLPDWIGEVEQKELFSALAAEESQVPEILVHGFYDFTDLNLQCLTSLSRRLEMKLFYPFARKEKVAHPAFAFAHPVLEELRLRFGASLAQESRLDEADSEISFFLDTFPEGEVSPSSPSFLSYQRASGLRAELISAAVRIRRWLDENPGWRPEDILVVAPVIEPYYAPAREIFSAFAIPLRVVDLRLTLTPERRPLLMLRHIWEGSAPVEWLLAYLRESPGLLRQRKIRLNTLEKKLRSIPLWGGEGWAALLQNEGDPQGRSPDFSERERGLIREIVSLWVEGRKLEMSAAEAVECLQKIEAGWIEEPALLRPLREALELVARHRPNLRISESLLLQLLTDPGETQLHSDPTGQPGVVLAPLMRSRALTAKALVILGLASGQLPARFDEDPLLSDGSRLRLIRLGGQLGHRIPLKTLATEEMSLLFLLLNTSASHVHWVIPDTDEAGRSVAPSPWVQRYLQHWEEEGGSPPGRKIPRGPAEQAVHLLELSPRGSFLPPEYGLLVEPELAKSARHSSFYDYLWRHLQVRKDDPLWNGLVPSAAVRDESATKRVSVTELELLARCPYRFYVQALARWEPLRLRNFSEELEALEWGWLVHGFLEHLLEPYQKKSSLKEAAENLLAGGGQKLKEAIEHLPASLHAVTRFFPRILANALRSRLFQMISAYLETLREESWGQVWTEELEVKIRRPFPGMEELPISGQLDRVDLRNGLPHVVDYKSGKRPWPNNREKEWEVRAGYRMQPYLYPWLYLDAHPDRPFPGFSYVFLSGESAPDEEITVEGDAEDLLLPLAGLLKEGLYPPVSTEGLEKSGVRGLKPCSWCRNISLCRRFEEGTLLHGVPLLQSRAPERFRRLASAIGVPGEEEEDGS